MLKAILGFELRQQFGNPVFWVVAVVFALLGFGASSSDAVQLGGSIGNVMRNAPSVIVGFANFFTVLSMFLVTIFIGASALRDFENRTAELFFATPMKKRDYLAGRFAGGYLAATVVVLFALLGIFIGYGMPWVDAARIGPHSPAPYAWALFVVILPNLLFIGALLFGLAVATRSMLATYIGVIAFFALNLVTGVLTADLDTRWIGALLDPFGSGAIEDATRYWSTTERNTLLPPLSGWLLANRVLWMGAGVALLGLAYRLFRTDREGLTLWRRKPRKGAAGGTASAAAAPLRLPAATLRTDFAAQCRQFLHQAWFDTRGVLRGVPLLVMLGIGLLLLIVGMVFGDQIFGTTLYPTTIRMSTQIAGSFSLFLIIIVTFYAGELVWRERQQRIADVTDAYPNADWIPLAAKLVALTAVIFLFYSAGIVTTVIAQLVTGYTRLQPGLYVSQMVLACGGFVLMGVLAVFLQVITNSKFIGYLAMVIYLVSRVVLGILEFDDNLYRPFGAPGALYSDMNGYGHFLAGHLWFRAYWGAFAGLLLVAALLFWVRGHRTSWPERLREARRRFTAAPRVLAAAFALLFVGLGAWLFYNTHVLNSYEPGDLAEERAARYEKAYRQYKDLPQPRIVAMRTEVDIHPETRNVQIRGHYRLVNKHAVPIDTLHVEMWDELAVKKLEFAPHSVLSDDKELGHAIYKLDAPMAPGAEMDFDFEVAFEPRGVRNGTGPTQVVENGTFFTSGVLPGFGYDAGRQLVDRGDRRKHELPDVPRMPALGDEAARANTYISDDADWIDFETIVSTAPDQVALAPGYLQREWTQDGRRYFHYVMDVPMLPFAAWLSARWDVRRGDWHGMPIEVYYHPAHAYNVDRMIEAAKKSFDYYNAHFTPYQHKQLRILEFPGYSQYAQSFANTVPYSESIGFVADLRDPEAIDYVFYITAHEVAHQWWAHRIIGANMQGSTLLSESLSQYSALMVMEKEYGPHRMRKFLRYELDNYLAQRATELVQELPLAKVENQQYIHYRKGSLVFYALKDAIGEDTLNAILKRYLEDKGFQQPPYTTSTEFLDYLRAGTDPKHHKLIADLFEKIVFFDNRVTEATAARRADGKYVVTLAVHSGKIEAAGKGEETDVPLDDEIDIGVFARPEGGKESDERVLYLRKHRITQAETSIEVVVDELPFDAGIDPYNKLIDRVPADNRKALSVE
jgi:hypothetical protein